MNVSGVNPSQSDRAELCVESETVNYYREPPPPYSPTESAAVTDQPVHHTTIIVQPPLTLKPTYYTCHNCHERVLTKVEYVATRKTHMLAGFICGFTFWCLLCCVAAIPYITPTFKNARHYCPNCNILLGVYSKI